MKNLFRKFLSIGLLLALAGSAVAGPFGNDLLLSSGGSSGHILAATNNANTKFFTSDSTAVTWSVQTGVSSCNGPILWNGSIFAAVNFATGTAACSSPDGATWTSRSLPTAAGGSMAFGNGTFCVIDGDLGAGTTGADSSTNGTSWTPRTIPTGSMVAIGFDGTNFVGVTDSTTTSYTSPDCITWTSHAAALAGINTWQAIATNGAGGLVVVSQNSGAHGIVYGTATSLAAANPGVSPLYDVAYGNGVFCAVGGNGGGTDYYAYSSTGASWTTGLVTTSNASWRSIKFNGQVFVIADASAVKVGFWTSPDCHTWTQQTAANNGTVFHRGIAAQWLQFGTY